MKQLENPDSRKMISGKLQKHALFSKVSFLQKTIRKTLLHTPAPHIFRKVTISAAEEPPRVAIWATEEPYGRGSTHPLFQSHGKRVSTHNLDNKIYIYIYIYFFTLSIVFVLSVMFCTRFCFLSDALFWDSCFYDTSMHLILNLALLSIL